ncbi:MAG: cation:proton antiporter [Pseudomonadota bacterium]
MQTGLLIIMLCAVAYAMFAKRLASSVVTAPMIFLTLGYLLSTSGIMHQEHTEELLHIVAEVALIILLFVDATQIDFAALRKQHVLPQRMLLIGLPLSVLIGTVVATFLYPDWSIFAVALLAAILAPTDAALGQAVVSNQAVPVAERRTLTVESGLNDGLALPVVLFFACTLATMEGEHQSNFLIFTAQQLILGPIVGGAIGWLGAKAMLHAADKDYTEPLYEGVAAIALAIGAYIAANMAGGNGFIAAFVGGLAFGHILKDRVKYVFEFAESEGQILIWASFLLLGMALLPEALHQLDLPMLLLILISLFAIRPLAIWLSLIGTETKPITRLFFGWFGPRGLATALFALLIVGDINHAYADAVLAVAINAVWISALLHGVSAAPGAQWYARTIQRSEQG